MITGRSTVTAFAPATVANVAVGFDLLGFALESVGDLVTATRTDRRGHIEIADIRGADLPLDSDRNTATVGLKQWMLDLKPPFGLRLEIEKGIPLASGMGGSAASAVAAIVAANALLDRPQPREGLLHYALEGEKLASGSRHADNAAPSLLGGLIFAQSLDPVRLVSIPFPQQIRCVVVHPDVKVPTKEARAALKKEIPLELHVKQSARFGGFLAACFQNDLSLLQASLEDLLIEPQRAHLIPGFAQVKAAALQAGALGCSISGAGPSLFALTASSQVAAAVCEAMTAAFRNAGVKDVHSWISGINTQGAVLV